MNDRRPRPVTAAGTEFGLQISSPALGVFSDRNGPISDKGATIAMVNRKGVFIGAYVPNELKESLRRRAAAEHRTLSQEITRILIEAVHGKGLPSGSIDRREGVVVPRRRATDPMPRRRSVDLPYVTKDDGEKKE